MKKLISLFLSLCMALTMVSALAEAPAAQPFLGDWTVVTVTMDGEEINYPNMGINFGYAFNEDGTVVLFADGEEIDSALWEEKDGAVTLIASEDSFGVTLEDNKLYMTKEDAVMMLMRPQDVPEQTGEIPGFDLNLLAALFSDMDETSGEEDDLGAMLGGLFGGLFSGEDESGEEKEGLGAKIGGLFGGLFSGEDGSGEEKEGLGSRIGGFFGGLFSGEDGSGEEKEGLGSRIGGFFSGLFSSEGEDAEDASYLPSTVVAAESKEQFFGAWQFTRILIGSDEEPILSLNMQDLAEYSDSEELRFTISDGVFTHLENGEEKAETYAMELVDGALSLTGEKDAMKLYLTDAGEIVINAGILNIFLSPAAGEAETLAA